MTVQLRQDQSQSQENEKYGADVHIESETDKPHGQSDQAEDLRSHSWAGEAEDEGIKADQH